MDFFDKIKIFLHRLSHWEYWPVWVIYFPCLVIYPYYAIKSRSTFFFTVSNMGIENSGAFLTSKYDIYQSFKSDLIPKTFLIDSDTSTADCSQWIDNNIASYPVIVKPDYGLRGFGLKLLKSKEEVIQFTENVDQRYILQEYIDYKNEIGVFLIRKKGELIISGIVEKEFISIVGDGVRTLHELILSNPRYAMQYEYLINQRADHLNLVLDKDELLSFDRIGNHSKGSVFKNGNYLISDQLTTVMSDAVSTIDHFNYGRLDIKFESQSALSKGEGFKVLELNGAFSEPAHIYDPSNSLFNSWKVLLFHFKSLFEISLNSLNEGNKPYNFIEGVKKLIEHSKVTKRIKSY